MRRRNTPPCSLLLYFSREFATSSGAGRGRPAKIVAARLRPSARPYGEKSPALRPPRPTQGGRQGVSTAVGYVGRQSGSKRMSLVSLSSSEALPYAHVQVYFDGPSHYRHSFFPSHGIPASCIMFARRYGRTYRCYFGCNPMPVILFVVLTD